MLEMQSLHEPESFARHGARARKLEMQRSHGLKSFSGELAASEKLDLSPGPSPSGEG
jgi:hypothetical protein